MPFSKTINKRSLAVKIIASLFCLFATLNCSAHPDVKSRIEILTDQILADSNNVDLYLSRAQVYFENQKWSLAKSDLDQAKLLHPANKSIDFFQGLYYLGINKPELAKQNLTTFINSNSLNQSLKVQAEIYLGELYSAEYHFEAAANHFKQALNKSINPPANLYFTAAQSFLSIDSDIKFKAIPIINKGLMHYPGYLPLLELKINSTQQTGTSLKYQQNIEQLLAIYPNHPKWQQKLRQLKTKGPDEK